TTRARLGLRRTICPKSLMARVVVGQRSLVDRVWRTLVKHGTRARLSRDQIGYRLVRADANLPPPLDLIPATFEHIDQVVQASAAMAREEARDDPYARNPKLFRERIAERLRRGRDFIYAPNHRLQFKSNVASLSPLGGQIEGIYTVPAFRHQGLGARGTSAVTEWVLTRAERAFLLVNEDNAEARRLYERLGYRPVFESRTVFAV
ncbi:MAG: GNAT family N-acetyltransferase, partial [Myxococcota bacterium]